MYDILFIDDKFKEIKETFSYLQDKHIRCFYSDGDKYLPQSGRERLPFQNLKYISLDLHLENRGITVIKDNKMALSTLSSVIKSFVNDGKDITIIVNTSFPDEFDESCFFKYLEFKTNPIIKKEEKSAEVSVLHNNAKDIVAQAHQEILRNVVIREAIEIENLIYIKVQKNFKSIALKLLNNQLDKIKKFDFRAKIQLYELLNNNEICERLNDLRELRNKFAHGSSPPEADLLDFLEDMKKLKQRI